MLWNQPTVWVEGTEWTRSGEDFLSCPARDGLEGNSESASGFASQTLYTSRSK